MDSRGNSNKMMMIEMDNSKMTIEMGNNNMKALIIHQTLQVNRSQRNSHKAGTYNHKVETHKADTHNHKIDSHKITPITDTLNQISPHKCTKPKHHSIPSHRTTFYNNNNTLYNNSISTNK